MSSPGDVVGAYSLIRQIGAGGMGTVWLAEHATLQRHAAVKLLRKEYSVRPDLVRRFVNEARAAASISHPGIVQIYELGETSDGTVYIVMELLQGQPLNKRIAKRPLGLEESLRIVRQVASAVGAAHARGIVHRDLKPDNIFMAIDPDMPGGERAKVLDFGIAKLLEDPGAGGTGARVMLGTPAYMSPEQARGLKEVDQRSDVYSLGCMLFRLVTGTRVFSGTGEGDFIVHHVATPAPLASSRIDGIPPAVDALIARCLEKLPEHRFASGNELATAIAHVFDADAAETTRMPRREVTAALEQPEPFRTVRLGPAGAALGSAPLQQGDALTPRGTPGDVPGTTPLGPPGAGVLTTPIRRRGPGADADDVHIAASSVAASALVEPPQATTLSGSSGVVARFPKRPRRRGRLVGLAIGAVVVGLAGGVMFARAYDVADSVGDRPQVASASAPADDVAPPAEDRPVAPAVTVEQARDAAPLAESGSDAAGSDSTAADPELARAHVRATEQTIAAAAGAFVAWARAHPRAACPDASALGATLVDGWGQRIAVTCDGQPADQQIGFISAGPDRQRGTDDDIVSWRLDLARSLLSGRRWRPKASSPTPRRGTKAPAVRAEPVAPTKDSVRGVEPAAPAEGGVPGDEDGDGIPDRRAPLR